MKNVDMLLTGGFVAVTVVAVLTVHILQPDPAEGFVCRTRQVADPNWVLSHPTPLEPGRLKEDD
ncbi:hypothetical protein [Streptomyces sp. T028]|uniref:hypothetical protein n=1 Tax=Streptomyces sp. T028 TaxID=3394379 RepID=UPI003A83B519